MRREESESIRSEWAVLGAGEAAPNRQKVRAANNDCSLFHARRPRGAGLGLRDVPSWPRSLTPLATPDSPVHKPCRPMAQAHLQSTASHSSGVTRPKRDRLGAIWWLAGRQGLRPNVLSVSPAPHSAFHLPAFL